MCAKNPICLLLAFGILLETLCDHSHETCSQNSLVDNKIKFVCYL